MFSEAKCQSLIAWLKGLAGGFLRPPCFFSLLPLDIHRLVQLSLIMSAGATTDGQTAPATTVAVSQNDSIQSKRIELYNKLKVLLNSSALQIRQNSPKFAKIPQNSPKSAKIRRFPEPEAVPAETARLQYTPPLASNCARPAAALRDHVPTTGR